MSELPLFPLHTVLFPHTPIQLHIFEERYQHMIGMCLQEKRPFGVVLIRRGAEALGPLAMPYDVGCTADIIATQPLEAGRMNLVALGVERFTIRSLDRASHPYLTARVEFLPWRVHQPEVLEQRADTLRVQLRSYLDRLVHLSDKNEVFDARKLPENPFELACLAAAVLEIDPVAKQALLECATQDELGESLQVSYRREAALVRTLHDHAHKDEPPFSLN